MTGTSRSGMTQAVRGIESAPPRRSDGPAREYLADGTEVSGDSTRVLVIRAVNATLATDSQLGQLAAEVGRVNGAWLLVAERIGKLEEGVRELRRHARQSQHEIHGVKADLTHSQTIQLREAHESALRRVHALEKEAEESARWLRRRLLSAGIAAGTAVLVALVLAFLTLVAPHLHGG